jgi:NAD(P)-dependent dehydrogenase (short-subunit alcohol dehydrogenase family)
MMRVMDAVAIVTGVNSGIGRATALHLAAQGMRVFGTVRSLPKATKLQRMAAEAAVTVELVELDVADDESVTQGFEHILNLTDHVDLLVNNAGVGPIAVAEHCPTSMYLDTFNVNVGGAVRCTQAVLPGMRSRRNGCIVNIGSFTGKVAATAQSPYVASKFALEGWTEGLAQEVAGFGIRVKLLEPGVTRTAIQAKNSDAPNASGAYTAHYRRMFRFYLAGLAHGSEPAEVAEVVHQAYLDHSDTLRYVCCWGAAESIAGRAQMSDADWVALGTETEDADYFAHFRDLFGLDLTAADTREPLADSGS